MILALVSPMGECVRACMRMYVNACVDVIVKIYICARAGVVCMRMRVWVKEGRRSVAIGGDWWRSMAHAHLVDTTAFVDEVTGRGRLASIDVADDDEVHWGVRGERGHEMSEGNVRVLDVADL